MNQFQEQNGKLVLNLTLENFSEVMVLVNKIAEIAEELDHHPDMKIHGYKNLDIEIYSHDVGEITKRDRELAERIEELLT